MQMCATLLGRCQLMNVYKMHAEWFIPFVDKLGWQVKLCEPRAIQPRVAPLVTVKSSLSVGQCAFALIVKTTLSCTVSEILPHLQCT